MPRPKAEQSMQRVMITLPPDLLDTVGQVTRRLKSNRSELIRQALVFYLDELKRQELTRQMKEGYLVNAERDFRICNEFAHAGTEIGA